MTAAVQMWNMSEKVMPFTEESKLLGTWLVHCVTNPSFLSGDMYSFGFAGDKALPDWSEVDVAMSGFSTGDDVGPVVWQAERVGVMLGELCRQVLRRTYTEAGAP